MEWRSFIYIHKKQSQWCGMGSEDWQSTAEMLVLQANTANHRERMAPSYMYFTHQEALGILPG